MERLGARRRLSVTPVCRWHDTARALGVFLAAALCASADATQPLQIDVITTASQRVTMGSLTRDRAVQVTVAEVDAIAQFEATLSDQLPADPAIAQREVHRRLAALQTASLPAVRRAAMGIALASALGIDRAPAIVFDGAAVIYGELDVEVALRRYRAWVVQSR